MRKTFQKLNPIPTKQNFKSTDIKWFGLPVCALTDQSLSIPGPTWMTDPRRPLICPPDMHDKSREHTIALNYTLQNEKTKILKHSSSHLTPVSLPFFLLVSSRFILSIARVMPVRILAGTPAILTDGLRGFPQALHGKVRTVHDTMTWQSPS